MTTVAPFGTWASPISAADTVGGVVGFAQIALDGNELYWVESRPSEAGRQVLVRRDGAGVVEDQTPRPANVRSRVHEYGGGSVVVGGGPVAYSEFSDQRLYGLDGIPLTPEPSHPAALRYADGRHLPDGGIVCVRERHEDSGIINEIVRVGRGEDVVVVAGGADFYSNPRPSPEGDRLLWLEWDHPNMPWDGTTLKIGRWGDTGLEDVRTVAGGADESVFQPEWDPAERIVFSSDRSGWWNLYRSDGEQDITRLHEMEADVGQPAWGFALSTYGFLAHDRILLAFWDDAIHHLAVLATDGSLTPIPTPFTRHDYLVTDGGSRAWLAGSGPQHPAGIFELDVDTGTLETIRSNPMPAGADYFPTARTISFPTSNGATAHAVFYPPANPAHVAPTDERPPLIVKVHGGPTSHVHPQLSAGLLYWTSRGFAVVDVNYRGSSGYGRTYRNQLRDAWGIADVQDCLAAARHLVEADEVDADRLVIKGGSAGGYTTLAALAFGDVFRAGASYYGVADIGLLAAHTHKFESRYLDRLIGTDPEEWRRRSPLYSADQITVPVILFQGSEDEVVPPEQAELIADRLAHNGVPHALVVYEGEGHGFRRAENIIHSLESELAFYGTVFGFTPAGDPPPPVPLVGGFQ